MCLYIILIRGLLSAHILPASVFSRGQGRHCSAVRDPVHSPHSLQCCWLFVLWTPDNQAGTLLSISVPLHGSLTCIGAGLFVTLRPGTETAPVVGYQVLYGFGSGLGFQLPQIAAQTVLKETEVQIGIAMTLFFQSLGGTLFLSVGNSVFKEQLRNRLLEHAGLSAQQLKVILSAGAVAIESTLQPKELEAVRSGYSEALIYAYYTALAASILSAFGGLFVEWKSVTEKVPSSS
ncbi:hypothetical protein NXS19_008271 [Fusarium pseudograminearum]|nr:hypothetical protein NXS19_008271 [Fusarium pseudograminearum]